MKQTQKWFFLDFILPRAELIFIFVDSRGLVGLATEKPHVRIKFLPMFTD